MLQEFTNPAIAMAEELTMAAAKGNVQRVKEQLERGANPNAPNSHGRTAIQVMMMGSPLIAQLLIDHGADPTAPDPRTGTCPAHDAIREGFLETLVVLLDGGARVDGPQDNFGQSPIDLASPSVIEKLTALGIVMMMGDSNMAQILLDYSANPNVPDPDSGRFPAHDAARQGFLDTLIVLLNGKAHIHTPDRSGRLPLDLAPGPIVAALQSLGIVSASKKHIMQETMEPMIRLH